MIDEKKIKEAATKYAGKRPKDLLSTERQSSFKDGAEWAQEEFVKSLWHDASEEPAKDTLCIGRYEAFDYSGFFKVTELSKPWDGYVRHTSLMKWCYFGDILPKEGDK